MSRLSLVAWNLQAGALAALRGAGLLGRAPTGKIKRILVLGYNAIGDLIMFLPTLAALRRANPEAQIVFVADRGATTLEIVPSSGFVDEVILFDFQTADAAARSKINAELADRDFDAVVVSLPTPVQWFVPVLASIPLRIGHRSQLTPPAHLTEFQGVLWSLRRAFVTAEIPRRMLFDRAPWAVPGRHSILRSLDLAKASYADVSQTRPQLNIAASAKAFAERELGAKRKLLRVAVHLGVPDNPYGKIWPAERFGGIIRRLSAKGVECVLIGGRDEDSATAKARASAGIELRSWAGTCTLVESFALIAACDAFIGCDTGLAKAATALGVPTATIWGPTDPAELGPIDEKVPFLNIRRGIGCSPCVRQGMPFAKDRIDYLTCGTRDCLAGLSEDEVFSALSAWGPLKF